VTVFTLLNGYRSFTAWSPWAARDPDTQYQYSGPDSGVGARMDWSGDPRLVGKGWQRISASVPNSLIRAQLDFDQQGEAETYFTIAEEGDGVLLTWGFDTDLTTGQGFLSGILGKYFGLFFDKWIGADYEEGLANFKAFAESLPPADFSDLEVEIVDAQPLDILYVPSGSNQEPDDIAAALASAYREISSFMAENGIEMQAQPMSITHAWDENGYQFDAAIPVTTVPAELSGNVQAGQSPSGKAVRVVHHGSYDSMMPTYEKLAAYMAVHGLREGSASWEHYISDPGVTPQDDLITHVYFLIAP
jgi:effector-binding domain-containing protein